MLVLSRKSGEQLRIGDDITITVLEIKKGRMRIGIEAPRERRVLRAELDCVSGKGDSPQFRSADSAKLGTVPAEPQKCISPTSTAGRLLKPGARGSHALRCQLSAAG